MASQLSLQMLFPSLSQQVSLSGRAVESTSDVSANEHISQDPS